MYLKVHNTKQGRIVAACDKELLGKVLDDGKVYLDLETHRSFYEGALSEPEELKKELKQFSSANLVGEKAVKTAIELELGDEDDIIYINKIPHIQLYKVGGL
jgi:hypothetical protein